MADRPSILEVGQVGVEVTPQTPVAATKILSSLEWAIGPKFTFKEVSPVGAKIATAEIAGQEYTDITLKAANAFFEDMAYILDSQIKKVTPTRIIPSTGLAYSRVYTPTTYGLDTHQTYTLEKGSSARGEQIAGVTVDQSHLVWNRTGVTYDGKAFGAAMVDPFSLTGGTTASDNTPITGNSIDGYADPTSGALGSTKLLRDFEGDLTIGPHLGMIWPLDSSKTSYDGTIEQKMPAQLIITVGADAAGMAFLTNARNGTKIFFRQTIKGPLIETGTPNNYYLLQIDFCGEVSNVAQLADRGGIVAIAWTLNAIHDPTWGKALQITLVNQLAAL